MATQKVASQTSFALTGNETAAFAMRQLEPDVVAAYPITPQTELMQTFAKYEADGKTQAELVLVESEHSAMSASVGSAAAGARSMTATSSQGLALMWEILYIAAALRLPIVMAVVNRALSGPINIHCDHSDTMGARDAGWIQLYSANCQEVYDNMIKAVKVAEDPAVRLPVMVMLDGFITSHTVERVDTLADDAVRQFVGRPEPAYSVLDVKHPVTVGPLDFHDYYFEHKRSQAEGMEKAPAVLARVDEEYARLAGRAAGPLLTYRLEDAEVAMVALNSTASTARVAVDEARKKGIAAGLIQWRTFRPFPLEDIRRSAQKLRALAVLDRSASWGAFGGPVAMEVRSALWGAAPNLPVLSYIYGLGGREATLDQLARVMDDLRRAVEGKADTDKITYLGVRGEEEGR